MEKNNIYLLASELNEIQINTSDLLDVILFYSKKMNKELTHEESEVLDQLFNNKDFINLLLRITKESIIISVQSIMLDNKVAFESLLKEVVKRCDLSVFDDNDHQLIKKFVFFVRKSIYARTLLENKDFVKSAKLDGNNVDERKKIFLRHIAE